MLLGHGPQQASCEAKGGTTSNVACVYTSSQSIHTTTTYTGASAEISMKSSP